MLHPQVSGKGSSGGAGAAASAYGGAGRSGNNLSAGAIPIHMVAVPPSPAAMLSTSPGSGWQRFLPEQIPDSPKKSLVPPKPMPPKCQVEDDSDGELLVTWDDGLVTGVGTGVAYTLAVVAESGEYHDIYTGHDAYHEATGFATGDSVRFAVKSSNFFGISDYSAPSELFLVPKMEVEEEPDDRPDCRLFMAGLCFKGAACEFSHGTGLQNADDVAVALMAAAAVNNVDVQMAAAMAASLADFATPTFDESALPQYKRDYHEKVVALREKNAVSSGCCSFSVVRQELFKSSFFEVSRRKASELKQQLKIDFSGEGGLDYGGLAREWFSLLSREIFHPTLGMFEYSSESDYTLRINNNSAIEPDHLYVHLMVCLFVFFILLTFSG